MSVRARLIEHPENAAAIANGLLVLALPAVLIGVISILPDSSDTSVTVRPPGSMRPILNVIGGILFTTTAALPFAAAAGWRTLVHARRTIDTGIAGWRGLWDGALLGFAGAALVLLPPTLMRPLQAPPYWIAYGTMAAALGLAIAFVLRATALLVLGLLKEREAC
jgi:hypothetical protein